MKKELQVATKPDKKKSKAKKNKKNTEPNPSYQRDLIECFKIGYSQLDGKGSETERLAIRENCRASGKKK